MCERWRQEYEETKPEVQELLDEIEAENAGGSDEENDEEEEEEEEKEEEQDKKSKISFIGSDY